MNKRSCLLSPKKPFRLLLYVEHAALGMWSLVVLNQNVHKHTYALNVLEFIDGSALEGRKTLESSSSMTQGSTMESIAT